MIIYSNNLYLTDKTKNNLEKIKKKIQSRSGMIGVVIIALSQNEKDAFELLFAPTFKGKIISRRDVYVCGVAENKEAAMDLVADMTEEYINSNQIYDENYSKISMREYFLKKFS